MNQNVVEYWERRFQEQGRIWGITASPAVKLFAWWLDEHQCKRVLVVGCGYGRSARYLAECGFRVDAVDTSPTAIRLAKEDAVADRPDGRREPLYDAWISDGTELETVETDSYDAVVADKLWHLFDASEREKAIQAWARVVRPGGLICCNAFASEDPSYLTGEIVGEETRCLPDGKIVFFTSSEQWRQVWHEFVSVNQGTLREEYGEVTLVLNFAIVRV
jgi:SAM-dependent methyltransferase